MTPERSRQGLSRRSFVGLGAAGLAAGVTLRASRGTSLAAGMLQQTPVTSGTNFAIDPNSWNPETIRKLAGTLEVNTAEEVAKVVPLDHKGKVSYWYVGPNQASPDIDKKIDAEFWAAFKETYPNIEVDRQNLDYNQMLDKVRTAALGGAAPCVAKMPILWGVEFAAKGQLQPVKLEEFSYSPDLFWEGALKSVTWEGQLYGIPTNNETMALIWNARSSPRPELDPEKAAGDLGRPRRLLEADQGEDRQGGLWAGRPGERRQHAVPLHAGVAWAYGGGALDEAEPQPTYEKMMIDSEGTQGGAAGVLRHVRARSVGADLGPDQHPDREPGSVHRRPARDGDQPSERVRGDGRSGEKATGSDKAIAQKVVDNMAYGLIPEGPVRRAVVFGGSNVHMFKPRTSSAGTATRRRRRR